jgi:hypothetical protein
MAAKRVAIAQFTNTVTILGMPRRFAIKAERTLTISTKQFIGLPFAAVLS